MGLGKKNNLGKLHTCKKSPVKKALHTAEALVVSTAVMFSADGCSKGENPKAESNLKPKNKVTDTLKRTHEEVERVFLLILNDHKGAIAKIEQYPDGSIAAYNEDDDIPKGSTLSFTPIDIAIDNDTDVVYVGGGGSSIERFNIDSGERINPAFSTAPAGDIYELEVVGDDILATTRDNLTIINKHTGTTTTVAVGENPLGIGVDKDRNIAGVVDEEGNSISLVNLESEKTVARIQDLFSYPIETLIKGDDLFVVGGRYNLTNINIAGFPNTDFSDRTEVVVGYRPRHLEFDKNENLLIVNKRDNTGCTVSIVYPDLSKTPGRINLGIRGTDNSPNPTGLELTHTNRFANVPLHSERALAVIDTADDYSVRKYFFTMRDGSPFSATAIDSWTVTSTPETHPPNACITPLPQETYLAGESVTFDANCTTEPDGDEVTYKWDFGDDTIIEGTDKATVEHTYNIETEEQDFTVTLTVTDRDGSDIATTTITIVEDAGGTSNSSDGSGSEDSTPGPDTGGTSSEDTDTTDLPTPGDSSTTEHTDSTDFTSTTDLPEGAHADYECKNIGDGPVFFGDGYENTLVGPDSCDILQVDDSFIELTPGQVRALKHFINGEETFVYGTDLESNIWLRHNNPDTRVIIIPVDDNPDLDPNGFGINEIGVGTLGTYFNLEQGYPPGLAARLNPDTLPEEKTIFVKVIKDPEKAKDEINAIEIVNTENNELTDFKHYMFVHEGYTILINLETGDYELYDEYNKYVEGGTLGEDSGEGTEETEEESPESTYAGTDEGQEGCGGVKEGCAVRTETGNKYPSPAALAWLFTILALLRKKGFVDRKSEEGQARMGFRKKLKDTIKKK